VGGAAANLAVSLRVGKMLMIYVHKIEKGFFAALRMTELGAYELPISQPVRKTRTPPTIT
jgi:hypothetical protein